MPDKPTHGSTPEESGRARFAVFGPMIIALAFAMVPIPWNRALAQDYSEAVLKDGVSSTQQDDDYVLLATEDIFAKYQEISADSENADSDSEMAADDQDNAGADDPIDTPATSTVAESTPEQKAVQEALDNGLCVVTGTVRYFDDPIVVCDYQGYEPELVLGGTTQWDREFVVIETDPSTVVCVPFAGNEGNPILRTLTLLSLDAEDPSWWKVRDGKTVTIAFDPDATMSPSDVRPPVGAPHVRSAVTVIAEGEVLLPIGAPLAPRSQESVKALHAYQAFLQDILDGCNGTYNLLPSALSDSLSSLTQYRGFAIGYFGDDDIPALLVYEDNVTGLGERCGYLGLYSYDSSTDSVYELNSCNANLKVTDARFYDAPPIGDGMGAVELFTERDDSSTRLWLSADPDNPDLGRSGRYLSVSEEDGNYYAWSCGPFDAEPYGGSQPLDPAEGRELYERNDYVAGDTVFYLFSQENIDSIV